MKEMHIGKGIKFLRKKRGLTTKKLSEITGIDNSHLSMIQSDKRRPNNTSLKKLCDALDTSFVYLVWYSLSEEDIPEDKKEIYRILKPSLDNLFDEVFEKKGFKY